MMKSMEEDLVDEEKHRLHCLDGQHSQDREYYSSFDGYDDDTLNGTSTLVCPCILLLSLQNPHSYTYIYTKMSWMSKLQQSRMFRLSWNEIACQNWKLSPTSLLLNNPFFLNAPITVWRPRWNDRKSCIANERATFNITLLVLFNKIFPNGILCGLYSHSDSMVSDRSKNTVHNHPQKSNFYKSCITQQPNACLL